MNIGANQERTFAFAGIAQASKIVTQLAADPKHDEKALRSSVRSMLNMSPDNIKTLFGDIDGVRLGLGAMQHMLKGKGFDASFHGKEMLRYAISLDALAVRLAQSPRVQSIIGAGLAEINSAFDSLLREDDLTDEAPDEAVDKEVGEGHRSAQYDALYLQVGLLYQETLSDLSPKIIVRGGSGKLSTDASVAKIRTALFAGVRAAYLWHQLGGRRWHLIFSRKGYIEAAQSLQAHI